jgi:WD repeat-containing protein 81
VASCDGTIHIWNGQTGKLIAAHAESSTSFPLQTASIEQANLLNQDALSGGILSSSTSFPLQTASIEQANLLNQDALSGGILSNAFRGSLYTTMHYMESNGILVAGIGNGSIRY